MEGNQQQKDDKKSKTLEFIVQDITKTYLESKASFSYLNLENWDIDLNSIELIKEKQKYCKKLSKFVKEVSINDTNRTKKVTTKQQKVFFNLLSFILSKELYSELKDSIDTIYRNQKIEDQNNNHNSDYQRLSDFRKEKNTPTYYGYKLEDNYRNPEVIRGFYGPSYYNNNNINNNNNNNSTKQENDNFSQKYLKEDIGLTEEEALQIALLESKELYESNNNNNHNDNIKDSKKEIGLEEEENINNIKKVKKALEKQLEILQYYILESKNKKEEKEFFDQIVEIEQEILNLETIIKLSSVKIVDE